MRVRPAAVLALAVTAAAAAAPGAGAAPAGTVAQTCKQTSDTAMSALTQALTGTDLGTVRQRAVELGRAGSRCAGRVARARATTARSRCARTVAARGLRAIGRAGTTVVAGIDAALAAGTATAAAEQFQQANALLSSGRAEVALAPSVFAGRRACKGGRVVPRPLSAATRAALPELAAQAAQLARDAQGAVYPEDAETFGMLVVQLDTGRPPPADAIAAALARARPQIPESDRWRIPGFRTFWATHGEIDWTRYRLDAAGVLSSFQTALIWKQTARQNAINQALAGIVGSEEAWAKALSSWRSYEQRWYTVEQASIASYDAYRTALGAEQALQAADAALQR